MKSVKTLIVSIILLSPICGFGYAITGSLAFANTITKYDVIDITKYHSISAITTENHTIVKDSSSNKADSAGSSVIGGGTDNKIDKRATHSVIPGGSDNTIEQYCEHSLAFGNGVTVGYSNRTIFYDCANWGRLLINHDDNDLPSVPADHIIHVGCNSTNGNNAWLSNTGNWNNGSSRDIKERFVMLDGNETLNKIRNMEILGWYYIDTEDYHIWPFAEDFYDAFGTGQGDSTSICATDVAGVGLVAIQELARQIEALKEENTELRGKLEALEREIEELR